MTESTLCVKDLTVHRQRKKLLDAINHRFAPNQLTVVLGPNGAGKSTLLQALSNTQNQALNQFGSVLWGEHSVHELAKQKRLASQLAYLPQKSHLTFPLLVKEVIDLGLLPHKLPGNKATQLIETASEITGIKTFLTQEYTQLSGGEQARAQLARVIAQILPTIAGSTPGEAALLLDEPVAALDVAVQHRVLAALKSLCTQGLTIIMVLHDVNLAMQYADEILAINQGQLVFSGSPQLISAQTLESIYGIQVRFVEVEEHSHPIVVFG